MEATFDVVIPPEATPGKRLDLYLVEDLQLGRRNRLKHQIEEVYCNGKAAKLSTRVGPGDHLKGRMRPPAPVHAQAEQVDFSIIREEPDYLVIDKPQGLVVHPGAGNRQGTLVNGLLWRYGEEPFFGATGEILPEPFRPGIVHRLDKDTSGVMIVARNMDTHHHLVEQFSRGAARKRYLAVVRGRLVPDQGEIDAPIGRDPRNRQRYTVTNRGKPSRTTWRVLRRYPGFTLVLLKPATGRTHQLRVHMNSRGTPILGDPMYGGRSESGETTLMLHALTLSLIPSPGAERELFRSAVPDRFHRFFRRFPDRTMVYSLDSKSR